MKNLIPVAVALLLTPCTESRSWHVRRSDVQQFQNVIQLIGEGMPVILGTLRVGVIRHNGATLSDKKIVR